MRLHSLSLHPNSSGKLLTRLASMSLLIATLAVETALPTSVAYDIGFFEFVPAIIAISYFEDRMIALAATFVMVAVGLLTRDVLHHPIDVGLWVQAILLLVAGGMIALTFHRQRQDYRTLLQVAEARLAALEATENRYRWAFERAAIGFANMNENGELQRSNKRLGEMTGYVEEELSSLPLSALVHPDDNHTLAEALTRLKDTTSFGSEIRLLRRDGTILWTRLALSLAVPADALPQSIFVVVDDISGERTAREALRAQKEWLDLALSSSRLGTWRIDFESGSVKGSAAFWEMMGLAPAPSRPLQELTAVVHPADLPNLMAPGELASGADYDAEIRIRRTGGHIRWIALRGRDELRDGRAQRIGVAADLTDRRITILLRAAAKKRERAMLEQRHRLNNLFPVITALVNMVGAPDNDIASYKQTLIEKIGALQATHLLLSRDGSLSASLRDLIVQELQPYMGTHDISISGPEIKMAEGSAESFAMIVHELTTNSVKHGALGTPAGRIEVVWQFVAQEPGADIVFEWSESGERRVSTSARRGFGSLIIGAGGEPIVGHSSKLEMLDHGLKYSVRLPPKAIGAS
ncbi:PAS domain S-box protein [Mesorhizobium sp. M7A.F.Ca.CA.002.10.1.1]|uniref:PAS domain-containing protein n=3 Tax=Phyllobacteriaceae TaxID=69277 RepID=UPI0007A93C58|nr:MULTISPECIES: PAS domain-containing protein [Mesorhizobium]AMX91667.1 diguanylate cyclase [Mesorhizobium ciceri]ARP66989.1 diguanylate cyclase [Mesorhizobium sp. WSM1497]MDF3210898.1 PAS domain-containing protein [Mesorhizobium sp. LMG15046]MDF3231926.1 PAS domain-containing protein [Mesorhizobium sp. DSM 30133]RUU23011.1 PAS domain S-box protein [Mesorhizobium sp. Primo-B]